MLVTELTVEGFTRIIIISMMIGFGFCYIAYSFAKVVLAKILPLKK